MERKPRILVVGSFVMDQIVTTSVMPQEGQTVFGRSFRKAPGGKGANQAVQAARLGAEVELVGKLGKDDNGEEMLRVCRQAGIQTQHVGLDERTQSGCAVILLEERPGCSALNRILVIPGANMTLTASDVAFLRDGIAAYDLVLLQLEIPMEVNELVARYAYEKGVPVMLNPAPSAALPESLLRHITYLSPNEHEAEDLTGIPIRRDGERVNRQDLERAAACLREKGAENVLITLGSGGAALFSREGSWYAPCASEVTAVDPTAAGDSFIGAFCVGLCCGWPLGDILRFANHTAALTVTKMGAMPSLPTLAQAEAFLREKTGSCPDTGSLKGDNAYVRE